MCGGKRLNDEGGGEDGHDLVFDCLLLFCMGLRMIY